MENAGSRFIKGVMSTGFASLISQVSGFIYIIIAVRFVPRDQFGVYILMQTVVTSLGALSDLGINLSTTKHLASYDEQNKMSTVNTILGFKLIIACVIGTMTLMCKGMLYDLFKSESFYLLFIYIPFVFIAESLCTLMSSILQGFHYYKRMAAAQIILSISGICLIFIFLVFLQMGLMGLIYARLLSLFFCFCYQVLPFVHSITFRFDKRRFKEVFNFGFPLGLNSILSFVFLRMDTLLIGALLNPLQVAYYGTSCKIPDASRNVFEMSFRSVFFPNMSELFSRGKKMEAERLLANSLRLISFLTLSCTLVIFLFQREIVRLLFSAKYLESAPILSLLMISLSIGLIGNILGTSMVAAGYSKLPVVINLVDTAVSLSSNLLLIPKFGAIGAAYAAVLSRVVTNPVNVFFLKKCGISVNVKEYVKPALMFVFCISANVWFGNDTIIFRILLLLLFLFACLVLSVICRYDLTAFMNCVRQRGQPLESGAQSESEMA